MNLRHCLGVLLSALGTVAATAAPLTNSWVAGTDGRWDAAANWSLGSAPDGTQAGAWVTNAGSKVINIDGLTAAASLTVSNLVLGAPGGTWNCN